MVYNLMQIHWETGEKYYVSRLAEVCISSGFYHKAEYKSKLENSFKYLLYNFQLRSEITEDVMNIWWL